MSTQEDKPSILDQLNLKSATRQALSSNLPSALIGALIVVVIIVVFCLCFAANIIQIAQSDWVVAVIVVGGLLLVAVVIGIYIARILDAIPSNKKLADEIRELSRDLESTKQQLALAQERLQIESDRQKEQREKLVREFVDYLENYIDDIDGYIEIARLYAENMILASDELRTTHVQIGDEGRLCVWFPIGKRHGAVENLTYYLYEADTDPEDAPSPLGTVSLWFLQKERSMGFVAPYASEAAARYWDQLHIQLQGMPKNSVRLQLKPLPVIPMFEATSVETLLNIRTSLLRIKQSTKAEINRRWRQIASSSAEDI